MNFEKYQDGIGEWRWRLRADNHSDIIADSGEGYKAERDCDHGIALVKSASNAPVTIAPKLKPLMSGAGKPTAVKPSTRPLPRPKPSR
jgi:uncharacterized protein